jgi:hypothetical protein
MVAIAEAILSQSVSTWYGPLRFPEAVTSPGLRLG